MFLSVVLSRLVLFCSCYVFIVCLISFASYIITRYMDDVRLSHLTKDYLLTYLLDSVYMYADEKAGITTSQVAVEYPQGIWHS